MTHRTCTVDGCDRKHKGRGYCELHLRRMKAHGGATEIPRRQPRGCAVPECGKPHEGRGFCKLHYDRWKRLGRIDLDPPRQGCTVDGCGKSHKAAGLCSMHYERTRRTGSVDIPHPWQQGCSVDGCDRKHSGNGYCSLHYVRMKRKGTVEYVGQPRIQDPNYYTVHGRLTRDLGPASRRQCVDCGNQAMHWSYNNDDPDECTSSTGLRYSPNGDAYQPRCVPCHRRFDLEVSA